METEQAKNERQENTDQNGLREHQPQHLFICRIKDDPSTPAEAICYGCLQAFEQLAQDTFYAAEASSQQFASGKLRPIGRRLDGLRLRIQIWMLDVSLDTTGATWVPPSQNDYFELAVGRKIRTISQSCKKVASCLKEMSEDFHFMASDLETAGYFYKLLKMISSVSTDL